jgi:hypothetical protein
MTSDTPLQPSYASEYRTPGRRVSVRPGSLRRLVCLVRLFTKRWASNLLNHAKEVFARWDRNLEIAILRWDRLSRLRFVLVSSHYDEARP